LFLDTGTALTWGPTIVPAGALLTYLAPATGVFTYLGTSADSGKEPVIAQLVHQGSATYARFSFLAPEAALDSDTFLELVDHLAVQVGERGAHNLVAEVNEGTRTYEVLRRAGFAIYARQRIWSIPEGVEYPPGEGVWSAVEAQDEIRVRALYNALVPGLTQQVESPPWERQRGLAYRYGGELLAYVSLTYGPRGIMVLPFFHPDAEGITARMTDLLAAIPNRRARPLYIVVRSYQSWLESALEEIGALQGERQAVMVKRVAVALKERALSPIPKITGTTANPTVPFTRSLTVADGPCPDAQLPLPAASLTDPPAEESRPKGAPARVGPHLQRRTSLRRRDGLPRPT
jgi:hypothetical protein